MLIVTGFAGQNWLITPAALAHGEAPPPSIAAQKWLLVLSGVALLDFKGTTTADWRRDTLLIRPDVNAPLNHAITRFNIPHPPNQLVMFQLEQWSPFAAISDIFDQNQAVNAGFAVTNWRPNPFLTQTDAVSGGQLTQLFSGILVDVAVRDSDAFLRRVSYNITLLGRIVSVRPEL
jgi:hypothetical protein